MKKLIFVLLVFGLGLIYLFDLTQYFELSYIKEILPNLKEAYQAKPLEVALVYFLLYVLATAVSFPGATVLTLLGGALFGLGPGLLIVSFASTIGATLAMLLARYFFRGTVERKFSKQIKQINSGVEKEGAFYLFSLRLIPIVPFFVINLAFGLTKMRLMTYYIVSQVGMLAGTAVYVNAGVELSKITTLKGLISFDLFLAFALLGTFPLLAKKFMNFLKAKKVYAGFKKPKKFDFNMIVIGGGAAGLVTAYISSAVKSKVALVEKNKMGGDCLNYGCVPSKAIIKSAKVASTINKSAKFGIDSSQASVNFKEVMGRVHHVIAAIEPHDSVERYKGLGVQCFTDHAEILSPWEVKIGEKTFTTKFITLATGAEPIVPAIPGIDGVNTLTSENLWELKELPKNFLIIGAGPIGVELGQAFARLGSQVTLVEKASRILIRDDAEVSTLIKKSLEEDGVEVLENCELTRFEGQKALMLHAGSEISREFDQVLIAIGRKARVKGFGLEKLGLNLRDNGTIWANDFLQTSMPNIFVCGDATGPIQLTHAAAHQAWFAAVNSHFGAFKRFKVTYDELPKAIYCDPEVASVGKSAQELEEEGVEFEEIRYDLDDLDRALCDSEIKGFVKVFTPKGKDTILGVSIVGQNASDILAEFVSVKKAGKGLNHILGTIHSYPTMSEANKYAAGVWKKANAPTGVLKVLEKFFKFQRGL